MQSTRRIPLFQRLEIESQSNCNRSCWFCPRTYDRSGDYLDETGKAVFHQLPTEKILDLLDQAKVLGFCGPVAFHFYSEPLLDKRNLMLAREARKRGMRPLLHTNGDILKQDRSLCQEVNEVYEYIVLGIYDYQTDQELEETKQFWRDKFSGTDIKFINIGLLGARTASSMGIPKALVPTDDRMAVPDLAFPNAPCRRPLIRMLIRYDGQMCNCCEDIHGEFNLGNVYENTLEQLWYSENHVQIIENLSAGGREHYQLCTNCPMSPSGPAPDGKRITIVPRHYKAELSKNSHANLPTDPPRKSVKS